MDIIPQILIVILLVLLNGFFVASEFALVSVRKTRIDELVKKGSRRALLVQKAIKNLDTFISATQLGITIASLGLGWVGEPAIAHFLESIFRNYFPSDFALVSSHTIAFAIAFSFITFLHIVLGELAPKTIALQRAETASLLIIRPLSLFATVFKPFIFVLNSAGIIVLKLIGFKGPSGHQLVHSEEEIKMILAQSAEEGEIEKGEAEMVYSVLRLADTPVKNVMVPKGKIIAFEKDTYLRNVIEVCQKNPHSRFPVYDKTLDQTIGFVHIKDIYRNLIARGTLSSIRELYWQFIMRNRDKRLSQMNVIRNVPKISETEKIDDVLISMRTKGVHMAIVRNELKKTVGIVTLEDIVESLVGEIHDEFEAPEAEHKTRIERIKELIKLQTV